MKIKSVVIIVNRNKERAVKAADEFSHWLKEKGIEVVMPMDDDPLYVEFEKSTPSSKHGYKIEYSADVVVTFGGDGTVLKAARLLKNDNTPLLTVNFGRVGFLAEVKPENLKRSFDNLIEDRYDLVRRRLLKGKVKETKQEFYALNDIIVANKDYRTLNLDIYIAGSFLYSYSCDGFVIASPTGSTAYSLSLGGPIMTQDVKAKVLIPVNPHTLFNRSLAVSEDEDVEIVTRDGRIKILTDGFIVDAPDSSTLNISSSDKHVNILRFEESSFVEHLRERLFKL